MTTRTTSFAASAEPSRAGRTRAIAAVCLGNALEFYDFLVYSLLATLMARLFFPFGENPLTSLMLSFAVFGTGFVMRPLGGLLIGLYADRAGRKAAMRLTLWLMALGALLFTVAPTYAQAGLVGPLVIIVARLLQGFAVGGQVGTATTILMEYAGSGSRAYYCSWQVFSQSLGTIMGALVVLTLSNLLSPEAMDSWGWRAVFAVGILAIPVSEYIRHRLRIAGKINHRLARQDHTGRAADLAIDKDRALGRERRNLAFLVRNQMGTEFDHDLTGAGGVHQALLAPHNLIERVGGGQTGQDYICLFADIGV